MFAFIDSFLDYGCTGDTSLIGDMVCDDELNTPECAYDWDDCCNPDSDLTNFCTDCECKAKDDFNFQAPVDPQVCDVEADWTCEADKNVEACNYDHGDCCGPVVYCPNPPCSPCHFTGFPLKSLQELGCNAKETHRNEMEDYQYCNADMNNKECMFDEGQCCFPIVWLRSADECPGFDSCFCHMDSAQHIMIAPHNQHAYMDDFYYIFNGYIEER